MLAEQTDFVIGVEGRTLPPDDRTRVGLRARLLPPPRSRVDR